MPDGTVQQRGELIKKQTLALNTGMFKRVETVTSRVKKQKRKRIP